MIRKIYIVFLVVSCLSAGKEDFVDIQAVNPNIRIDARYASSRNFTGKFLYCYPAMIVHREVAIGLHAVQQELEKHGYGLLIWDGYKSTADFQKMYEIALEQGGAALNHCDNPAVSVGYKNRGTQIELTLVDKAGNLLEMPTDFDDFSSQAASDCQEGLSFKAIKNRELLHAIMKKHGFGNWNKEWWYFYLDNELATQPCVEMTPEEMQEIVGRGL